MTGKSLPASYKKSLPVSEREPYRTSLYLLDIQFILNSQADRLFNKNHLNAYASEVSQISSLISRNDRKTNHQHAQTSIYKAFRKGA